MPIEYHNVSELMRTGVIEFNMFAARRIGGTTAAESWANASGGVSTVVGFLAAGALSTIGSPSLTVLSTALRQPVIDWTSAVLVPVQFPPVVLPPDWSTQHSSATFHILAGRDAAASSDAGPAWTIKWYNSSGSSNKSTISVTNLTSSVATEYTANMSASLAPTHPGPLTVTIAPLSTADHPKLHAAWIEYYRAPRG